MRKYALLLLLMIGWALGGCVAPVSHAEYRPYLARMPKSVLVLPPVNHSANVHASNAFLSTVTRPLAECGYYVYPIAVVDRLFKENGVPTPGDMHSVSLAKIDEIIGPDAVLYIDIREWTTTYIVIDSSTRVTLEYKLVDTKTGTLLWHRSETAVNSSSQGVNGSGGLADLVVMTISAQIHAAASAASDGEFERQTAEQAKISVFYNFDRGLLKGIRHPDFTKDQLRIQEILAKE